MLANNDNPLSGQKVLVMGLGLHGGGVATVKWLVKHGAKVTATDMRTRKELAPSLRALRGVSAKFVLGKHRASDFRIHDRIIVNPAVPRESPYIAIAEKAGKQVENVASLFFESLTNPVIAVTGTRGKTTTTLWVAELLKKKYRDTKASGSPENALLDEFERINGKKLPAVAELSSWQLEYLPVTTKAPHIAVITNLYPDHQNRYKSMSHYASAKANIFRHQGKDDILILNRDNEWHRYFLKKNPKSRVYFVSTEPLPKRLSGMYAKNGKLYFQHDGKKEKLFSVSRFQRERGAHNLANLMCAVLAVKLYDPNIKITERGVLRLPNPHMRQEVIYKKGALTVVNDSSATSPDGTIAAIRRFARDTQRQPLRISKRLPLGVGRTGQIILITGGTDKQLEFSELAHEISRHIRPEDVVALEGSATDKLAKALRPHGYALIPYETLGECVRVAFAIAKKKRGKTVILFSPAAASFEKFLHEFDRGERFSQLVKKISA
jgi:UDP-N-acetylmuramoylalanine--D-glutamate ligase